MTIRRRRFIRRRKDESGTAVAASPAFSMASCSARSTDGHLGMYARTSTPFGSAIKSLLLQKRPCRGCGVHDVRPGDASTLRGAAVAAAGSASAPQSTFATRVASTAHNARVLSSILRLRRSTTASLLSVRTSSAHVRPASMPGTPFGAEFEHA